MRLSFLVHHLSTSAMALALLCSIGCIGVVDHGPVALLPGVLEQGVRLTKISASPYRGLSDMTLGLYEQNKVLEGGALFVLPERQGTLLRLHSRGAPADSAPAGLLGPDPAASMSLPLDVVDALTLDPVVTGADTESLVALGPGLFAVGTETNEADRASDAIFFLAQQGNFLRVTKTLRFPYDLWSIKAAPNEGLEAMCGAAGQLLAASETALRGPAGQRLAPLGMVAGSGEGPWRPFFVHLSSDTGRLSAMTCQTTSSGQHIQILAIERHFGVARVIRFYVPLKGEPRAQPLVIPTEVVLDLSDMMRPVPNFESITQLPYGDVLLLSDNDMGAISGPSWALLLPRRVVAKAVPSEQ